MSVVTCINSAHAQGEITLDERDAMIKLYDELVAHYGSATEAKAEMVARLLRQAEQQKRQALISEQKRKEIETFVLDFRDSRGQQDPAAAMVALVEHHGQAHVPAGFSSVMGRYWAILGLAQGQMEELLHEFRRTWVTGGKTGEQKARLENLVREAFGEKTGDGLAARLAAAWSETSNQLRERFNAAGGAIGELKNWGLPQMHDRLALLNAGQAEWTTFITSRLDPARMTHPLTGKPMTTADLASSLDWIWKNVTSDGWHEKEATAQRRGLGAISNQRGESRFLVFKDAAAWLEYQAEFGGGSDPFATMMHHIKGMAEDIAAMEVLGPNPRAMLTYLQNFVTRQAALRAARLPAIFPEKTELFGASYEHGGSWLTSKNPEDYAREMVKLADNMWDIFRGHSGAAVNQRIADTFGTVRNLNVASKLGGAALSAVTDLGFQHMARQFAGLPQLGIYGDVLKAFATGPKRDAVRAGLILDTAVHVLHDEARWAGSMQGPVWSSYLADRTIAWSGLQAWTQAGKHGFGLAFMAELASRTGQSFGELHPALQRTFRRYGLTAAEWDAIRLEGGGSRAPRSVDLLTPTEVHTAMKAAGRDAERLAERYLEMILQETEYAVPTGTLRAKAASYGGLRKGVLIDEVWRSGLQFKMFGLSVALLQGQRIAAEITQNGFARGAAYAAALLATTTLYGALAIQLKEISKGRDPRPMTGDKAASFWGGAMLQGGGAGIYGDFLASETNRTGGGLARTIAGPTADVIAGLMSLSSKQAAEALRGEKTNFGRELTRFVGQNTPGGSVWYARAAYERLALDALQRQVDPEASQAFEHRRRQQLKDYGNEYWWEPGASSPRRGPRLGP